MYFTINLASFALIKALFPKESYPIKENFNSSSVDIPFNSSLFTLILAEDKSPGLTNNSLMNTTNLNNALNKTSSSMMSKTATNTFGVSKGKLSYAQQLDQFMATNNLKYIEPPKPPEPEPQPEPAVEEPVEPEPVKGKGKTTTTNSKKGKK